MHSHLDEATRLAHRRRNLMQTAALLGGLALLLAVPTWLIWGLPGVIVALIVVAALSVGSQQLPPDMVMRLYRARPVAAGDSSPLRRIVAVLADRAELSHHPAVYIVPSLTLNAFATGTPRHAAIALTEGLLRRLETRELAAVLAHEISHIANNDTGVMGLADIISRLTQAMSYSAAFLLALNLAGLFISGEAAVSWLAVLILYLAPALSSLFQLALSRTREYDADLEAAMLTGEPAWLASALGKLEQSNGTFWEDLTYPVPGRRSPQPSILRSHPTTSDRIRRLAALDRRLTEPPLTVPTGPTISLIGVGPATLHPRYRFPGLWY